MQDIDFDEIDRAVSSATGGKTDDAAPTPRDNTVPVKAAPAARRSSGRFMDVVHPSSDMRSSPAERSQPRSEEPVAAETPAPTAETTAWPDPLDFHGFKSDDTPEEAETLTPEKPLESPFLSDAKVEKRPLGAFSAVESTPAQESPVEEVAAEEPANPEEEPALLEAPETELLEATTEETPVETEPAVEEPIGPTSITQQYKEQAPAEDQTSGAIYDTEAYHQPLAHPVKKKSGALVVVWVLVLLLLGGGVGAAVYFIVLPMLQG